MQSARDVLTPDALAMLQAISAHGSFAAAARALDLVPSALTYRVRQIEDALDVLLYDRSSRQAQLTPAGAELLREGARLLDELDAVANRVKRVATGWEPQLTIAVDSIIARSTLLDLCEHFFTLKAPTRLKLLDETLSGTLASLTSGRADLALGVVLEPSTSAGIHAKPLSQLGFVFGVAPRHPLAKAKEPLSDEVLRAHRSVAVADSVQKFNSPAQQAMTVGVLGGQEVFTVDNMSTKLEAQLRGLGVGFLPEPIARPYIASGALVVKKTQRANRVIRPGYAWRGGASPDGRALQWWLKQLERTATREALLSHHALPVA